MVTIQTSFGRLTPLDQDLPSLRVSLIVITVSIRGYASCVTRLRRRREITRASFPLFAEIGADFAHQMPRVGAPHFALLSLVRYFVDDCRRSSGQYRREPRG
jgi:hypothetical protein